MTDEEKVANPTFHTCGGYLRINDMKEEWKAAYDNASPNDVQMVRELPNFDSTIFEEITGLDLSIQTGGCSGKSVVIDGIKYVLTKA